MEYIFIFETKFAKLRSSSRIYRFEPSIME